jgi:hypothetical protein
MRQDNPYDSNNLIRIPRRNLKLSLTIIIIAYNKRRRRMFLDPNNNNKFGIT